MTSILHSSLSSSSTNSKKTTENPQDLLKKYTHATTEKVDGVELDKAQIICMGDLHDEAWQKEWRSRLIEQYGSDGDIVLVEGFKAGQKIPQHYSSRFKTTKKLSCFGWDNLYLQQKHLDAFNGMEQLSKKYNEVNPSSKWSKMDLDLWNVLTKGEEACTYARTLELVKTAKAHARHLKQGQKMFIIAGSDHLSYKCQEAALAYYEFKIVNALKPFQTSMLIPKDFSGKSLEGKKL